MNLFAPNDHSAWRAALAPAPAGARAEATRAVRAWGLPAPGEVLQVAEAGKNARNLVLRWPDREPLVLRCYARPPSPGRVEALRRLARHLRPEGVPVAEPLPTTDGTAVAMVEGASYALAAFVEGDRFRGTREELVAVGVSLGALHRGLRDAPRDVRDVLAEGPRLPSRTETEARWRALADRARGAGDPLAADLAPRAPLVEAALAAWPAPAPAGRLQLVHGDLHPHNVLLREGRIAAVLDLDGVRLGDPLDDLAFALHRFVRQVVVHEGEAPRAAEVVPGLARSFLDAYASRAGTPAPGGGALVPAMRAQALRRLLIVLGLHYERHDRTWDGDLPKHLATLAEAAAFESAPRTVRAARAEDAPFLWRLANDLEVRRHAFHPDPIPWEAHVAWLRARLANDACRIFIVEEAGVPVAQVRYDRVSDKEAEIDVSVASGHRGRGLGRAALALTGEAACGALGVAAVVGVVFEDNAPSRRAFQGAGFGESAPRVVEGRRCAVYRWPPG